MKSDYRGIRALVVDDNSMNLYVANSILEGMDIVADCVPSGKACIKKVSKYQYDVIFLDHMMPECDGIETFKLLKQIPDFDIPVVVMTANVGEDYEKLYEKEGFCAYLPKPIDKERIENILNDVLRKRGWDRLENLAFDGIKDLANSGMPIKEYEILLDIFRDESREKISLAANCVNDGNIKDYAIIVHGLKNDAAMINDMDLSVHAKEHEVESKAGNISFVNEHWSELLSHWEETLERIDRYFE